MSSGPSIQFSWHLKYGSIPHSQMARLAGQVADSLGPIGVRTVSPIITTCPGFSLSPASALLEQCPELRKECLHLAKYIIHRLGFPRIVWTRPRSLTRRNHW
jgi:hypothetical protein